MATVRTIRLQDVAFPADCDRLVISFALYNSERQQIELYSDDGDSEGENLRLIEFVGYISSNFYGLGEPQTAKDGLHLRELRAIQPLMARAEKATRAAIDELGSLEPGQLVAVLAKAFKCKKVAVRNHNARDWQYEDAKYAGAVAARTVRLARERCAGKVSA